MMSIMRYPDGHKEEVRERIVQAASAALRRHGVAGVSIPALMKKAGLTHGGFYAHFENRDELVAEAVRMAASGTVKKVFDEGLHLEEALARYLSPAHLGHPEDGCVIAALGTDGPRQSAEVRRAFAEVVRGFFALIDRKLKPDGRASPPSDEAMVQAAMMVGAVVLGRLVNDATLAGRILASVRKASTH